MRESALRSRDAGNRPVTKNQSRDCPPRESGVLEQALKLCPSVSIKETVMEGQPCIAGTRIPVRAVLRAVEHYGSIEGALSCYPHLSSQNVKDALYFAQVVLEALPGGLDEITPANR